VGDVDEVDVAVVVEPTLPVALALLVPPELDEYVYT
jgi:hypothetical protein